MHTENIILSHKENTILPIHTENTTLSHTENIILPLHLYSVYTFSVCIGRMIISVCVLNRDLCVTYREFIQRISVYLYIQRMHTENIIVLHKENTILTIYKENTILLHRENISLPIHTENAYREIILSHKENTILPIHTENTTLLHTKNIIGVAMISRLLENTGFFCRI